MQNLINNFHNIKLKIFIIYIFLSITFSTYSLSEELEKNNYEFKSIKSDNANMRVGPGKRFEILWNFKKKGLPVKILKKFEQWYEVETPDGSRGWMWNKLLSNKQKTVIFNKNEDIYKKSSLESDIVAHVSKNAILKLHFCKNDWCKVESKKYKVIGYVRTNNIWGAYFNTAK